MSSKINVKFIGWPSDYRYAEEKRRVTSHIIALAKTKGFASALVLDMLIKHRYRAQGPWVDVHFCRSGDPETGAVSYVPARLWFNEDADLEREPEFFEEVQVDGSPGDQGST